MPTGWGRDEPSDEAEGDLPRAPQQYFVPADAGAPRDGAGARADAGTRGRPPGPAGSVPASAPAGPSRPPRPPRSARRRRWSRRRIVAAVLLGLLGLVLLFVLYGLWQFNQVEKVAVGDVLSSGGSGTNYLIVGSDSREGFDPNAPNAGAVVGPGAEVANGQRSDTMLILRTTDDGALMTSIPRDLWVRRADGSEGRINAAYRDGPEALIATIQQGVGIPIHHYVEVDFVSFSGLVDAVGGITIEFPHPARDTHSGLDVPTAGPVHLDGIQALAYVRARHYEELIDGNWVADPTADLGRVQRQQGFLRAVMSEVGGSRNPIEVMRVSSALAGGLRIDDSMGFLDALRFARSMRGLQPEPVEIPTYGYRAGDAAVLGLADGADGVIARFAD